MADVQAKQSLAPPPATTLQRLHSRTSSTSSGSGSGGGSSAGAGSGSSASFAAGHNYTPASVVPPSGGILNNAHEAPARPPGAAAGAKEGVAATLKGIFKHQPTPGKQMKRPPGAPPLGKTFERAQPIPIREVKGPQVLPFDPRGQDASVGDGIVLTPASADGSAEDDAEAHAAALRRGSNAADAEAAEAESSSASAISGSRSLLSSSPDGMSDASGLHRRESTVSTASTALSSNLGSSVGVSGSEGGSGETSSASGRSRQSSVASSSIRFCPLPVSGRLKRANSITIGVAARSHMLQSQGSARPNYSSSAYAPQPSPGGQQWLAPPSGPTWTQPPRASQQADVVDVGELMSKGALKAWRKVRGRSTSGASSDSRDSAGAGAGAGPKSPTAAEAAPAAEPVDEQGGHAAVPGADADAPGKSTPRRAASPPPVRGSIDADRLAHLQHDGGGSGAQTPRAGRQQHGSHAHAAGDALAHEDALPHLHRRLSTGTFLKDASLRQIQETRRRELLGDDADGAAPGGAEPEHAQPNGHATFEHARDQPLGTEHEDHKEQRGWIAGFVPRAVSAGLPGFLTGATAAEGAKEPSGDADTDDDNSDVFVEAPTSTLPAPHDDDGEEDDEETREAERLADMAISSHSNKAMRAGGIEKVERRKKNA